jgi:hypothetical protein
MTNTQQIIATEVPPAPNQAMVAQTKRDIGSWETATWDDMRRMASELAPSDLLPVHLRKNPASILIILQTAKELSVGPMQGISGIDVIQGKPCLKPEFQLALIRGKCPEAFISVQSDTKAMSVTVTMAPSRERMDESFTTSWDMARAKAMGLAGKDNYLKQPLVMMKWRAIGEAARTVFPHICRGMYNTEEAIDLAPQTPSSPSLKDLFKPRAVESSEIPLAAPQPNLKTFDDVDSPSELQLES